MTGSDRPVPVPSPRRERIGWRRLPRRQKRLVAAAVVFVAAAVVALWGAQPQEYVTPSQLAGNPGRYEGVVIQLRGVVEGVNATERTFVLADDAANVTVSYSGLPDGFQVGKEVIAKGALVAVSPLVFQAQEIIVGHAR